VKGLVWHGARDLRLEEVDEPGAPGPREAIVEVAYCGICGTDLHEYADGPIMIRPTPHPLTGESPPMVLGHEFAGRVVALGADAGSVPVGARVTVDPCWRCGDCYWCRAGDYHLCRLGGAVGLASNGGLARLVKVPAAGLVPLPDSVDDQMGAIVEPLAVGLHATHRARLAANDRVVIIGFGPVGAAVLAATVATGAGPSIVVEPEAVRRKAAELMGASEVLDPTSGDVRQKVMELTDRVGADVVFDCSGVPRLLPGSVELARRGGRVVVVGIGHGPAELVPNRLVFFERDVIGSLGYCDDLPRVVNLLAEGRLSPSGYVTSVVPLANAVTGAFDALLDNPEQLKILIDVKGS
jgi:(R,R)-butanediol dehydrogenase/meso-butanediol dehydrogenase/diacetyl reductase